jgi:hypothetical protein
MSPFEVYTRELVRGGAPKVTITNYGRFGINNTASNLLKQNHAGSVLLLWDKADHKIAIQAVKTADNSTYPLQTYSPEGNSGTGFSAITFLKFIGYNWTETRSFRAEWIAADNMLVFTIPPEHLTGMPAKLRTTKRRKETLSDATTAP